jgi:hypothetical protein
MALDSIGIQIALCGNMDTLQRAVEARTWLADNPNPSALAANRFWNTARARAFVESLYAAGATEVLIDNPGVDADGDPYADTLLVRCPAMSAARCKLERLCEHEGPSEVPGDFRMDVFENELRLWWD